MSSVPENWRAARFKDAMLCSTSSGLSDARAGGNSLHSERVAVPDAPPPIVSRGALDDAALELEGRGAAVDAAGAANGVVFVDRVLALGARADAPAMLAEAAESG